MIYLKSIFCLFASLLSSNQSQVYDYEDMPTIAEVAADPQDSELRATIVLRQIPQADDTVRILVHPSTDITSHSRTGAKAIYLVSTVSYQEQIEKLGEPLFTSGSLPEHLELYFEKNFVLEHIAMHEEARRKLLRYLLLGPPKRPFDCGEFASYLSGIPVRDDSYHKRFIPLPSDSIAPVNEVIAISSSAYPQEDDLTHYAYSIGHGLYISKFGTKGKVRITSLDEMNEFYEGKSAYRIVASS